MSHTIRRAALIAAMLAIPAAAFAQTSTAITRADVRADLVRVEQAGYMPGDGDATNYPADIQAAEARVSTQASAQTDGSYGGVPMQGTSASGRGQANATMKMKLKMNAPSACVGPAGFCTPYFGS
ncbi:DUF4148 domain-containing protein [Paraburkholderia sp. BCC1884]|uniref:DUF4148 domain-containing protein n=1 Tax=Paraburkholderia sp. BCC1884 TaxID=2562668 RepID=UPI0011835CF8|nr:DUF4148 domain-containing protein [Paraburkholderia sp. BCC1884]